MARIRKNLKGLIQNDFDPLLREKITINLEMLVYYSEVGIYDERIPVLSAYLGISMYFILIIYLLSI